jgi:hypothetical protein
MVRNMVFIYRLYTASQWPHGLRHRSAVACLPWLWVRIPPEAWMFDCCECCVLSDRGLCEELIIRPEELYRLWDVVECDLEASKMRWPWPALGRSATEKNTDSYHFTVSTVKFLLTLTLKTNLLKNNKFMIYSYLVNFRSSLFKVCICRSSIRLYVITGHKHKCKGSCLPQEYSVVRDKSRTR